MAEQVAGIGGLDVLFRIHGAPAVLLQQPDHALGEHAAFGGALLFQPQQALDAERQAVTLPYGPDGRRRHAMPIKRSCWLMRR